MKNIIYIIISILPWTKSVAQNISNLKYFNEITMAEQFFINEEYDKSIAKYIEVFKTNDKYFAKDCYIATEIAILDNDTLNFLNFLKFGFQRGLDINIIENDSLISSYIKKQSSFLNNEVNSSYDTCHKIYLNKINQIVRNEIEALVRKDMLYHNTNFETKIKWEIEYGKALDQNKRQILNYINTYGYPGEFLVGIKNTKMDNGCESNVGYNFELNENVSLEFFHNHCLFFESEKILKNEMVKGNIHPRMYAFYYEWAYSALKNKTDTIAREITFVETGETVKMYKTHIKLEDCNCILKNQGKFYGLYYGDYEPIWGDKKNEELNICRKEIGICTLEHDMKKKEFETKKEIKLYFGMFGEL